MARECARGARRGTGAQGEIAEELTLANGGRREYQDELDQVTTSVEWFGLILHLSVNVKH